MGFAASVLAEVSSSVACGAELLLLSSGLSLPWMAHRGCPADLEHFAALTRAVAVQRHLFDRPGPAG